MARVWLLPCRGDPNEKSVSTYKDSTSDLDKDAAIRVAGHGIDGCDLVFYPLEGETLETEQVTSR